MDSNLVVPAWPPAKKVIEIKDKVVNNEIPEEYFKKSVIISVCI